MFRYLEEVDDDYERQFEGSGGDDGEGSGGCPDDDLLCETVQGKYQHSIQFSGGVFEKQEVTAILNFKRRFLKKSLF